MSDDDARVAEERAEMALEEHRCRDARVLALLKRVDEALSDLRRRGIVLVSHEQPALREELAALIRELEGV